MKAQSLFGYVIGMVLSLMLLFGCGAPVVVTVVVVVTATAEAPTASPAPPVGTWRATLPRPMATPKSVEVTSVPKPTRTPRNVTPTHTLNAAQAATRTARAETAVVQLVTYTAIAPTTHARETSLAYERSTMTVVARTIVAQQRATATARAPSRNATLTAMEVSARATATFCGIAIASPAKVEYTVREGRYVWEWRFQLKETAGRNVRIMERRVNVHTVSRGLFTNRIDLTKRIPAYGKWEEPYWVRGGAEFLDATHVIIFVAVDEADMRCELSIITKLKDQTR